MLVWPIEDKMTDARCGATSQISYYKYPKNNLCMEKWSHENRKRWKVLER